MIRSKIKHIAFLLIIFSVVVPSTVLAATDSDTTTINANLGSTISITTSGTVGVNVTPTGAGSMSSDSDSVSVSTNNSAGYTLTLADSDANTNLVNGGNNSAAHTGTQASPTVLANNKWGYAVAAVGGFDASYATLTNVASSTTKWAGVPASGSEETIKTTAATASNDTTTVWYSVKADTSNPNGTYTDTVTYTATTN